jgi:predicted transcriptional regulator
MARHKPKELINVVGANLKKIAAEHDLSSRDIASRADMPQATVYKLLEGTHRGSTRWSRYATHCWYTRRC